MEKYEINRKFLENIEEKADLIREQTIKIHKMAPETRLASSLSCIEILTVLYYGKILNFDSSNPNWENRDRLIISKAHGAVSLYPILADLKLLNSNELENICKTGSIFGSIPDCNIGLESINGSLGHGLGLACGISIALKRKENNSKIFIVMGDGELWEGSVWEAIMLAGHNRLDNIILIIDKNQISMLDYTKNIIDLDPLEEKFKAFKWYTEKIDGHDIEKLYYYLETMKKNKDHKPKLLIANTIKGKGTILENDPLCHIKCLK